MNEWLKHSERPNGDRSLTFGDRDPEADHGHAVFDAIGNLKYIRDKDGTVTANDNPPNLDPWQPKE